MNNDATCEQAQLDDYPNYENELKTVASRASQKNDGRNKIFIQIENLFVIEKYITTTIQEIEEKNEYRQ